MQKQETVQRLDRNYLQSFTKFDTSKISFVMIIFMKITANCLDVDHLLRDNIFCTRWGLNFSL